MALQQEPHFPLMLDLVEWVAASNRPYAEVIDAWRTSCPRLTVWEDCVDGGYVRRIQRQGKPMVSVTDAGRSLLAAHGRGDHLRAV